VTPLVIDWVGETPMDGRAFTYTIDVDTRRARFQIVQLLRVTTTETRPGRAATRGRESIHDSKSVAVSNGQSY
jgi:hypothetical protein